MSNEHLDTSLLRVLEANHSRFGLEVVALASLVRQFGVRPEESLVEDRMDYLVDKGLAAPVEKTLGRGTRAWKITAKGRELLDELGF